MARQFATRRRTRRWAALPGVTLVTSSFGTLAGSGLGFTTPETVVRMIGGWYASIIGTLVDDDAAVVTLGIGVATTDAFAVGVGSLPDPQDEPAFPWLYWANMNLRQEGTAVNQAWGVGSQYKSFDVSSQRILRPGQTLFSVIQVSDGAGAPSVVVELEQTRVLLLES